MDITAITYVAGIVDYCALALVALWGAFCVVMVWRRVGRVRFRSERDQDAFLNQLDELISQGAMDQARAMCEGDPRALPQLVLLALNNLDLGYSRLRALLVDRFQRDVLADFEYRLSWIATVIKAAPMLGLFGTVVGMMGAFSKLAVQRNVEPNLLANDISLALITTAIGLAIAIPLVLATASINVRIRKLEDLVSFGLNRFLETLRQAAREPAWQR
ncbi:MAG: MotA/TolQ/ExbB proton channel family protein [Thermoguttaceae bacterium]|nr:MotA/TolQ/ExbB proton channel family protein [Thermoguttaceae bacterium]MDW8079001.1 MotA/TolQ/ExbB proton channel family protein [Thermoguttaceae bacterium]